jgi:hypothetical protein
MSKYLILWESVPGAMPTDPAQRAALIGKMVEMTKTSLNDGDITEWGIFSTGSAGYAIAGKDAANNFKGAMQFAPYYKFTPYEVLSLDEAARIMQSMKP